MSVTLGDLFSQYTLSDAERQFIVGGLSLDSRTVHEGDVFFACPGATEDGRCYLQTAIGKGAIAAVIEQDENQDFEVSEFDIPIIQAADVRKLAGEIASVFWGTPSSKLSVTAVTGTNGKTSVTQMLAEATEWLGKRSAVIGTLGNGPLTDLQETANTTPSSLIIQQTIASFVREGIQTVAIEASSHGLVQGRLAGTQIDIGVVTNISRDHLDYHGSMDAYRRAKAELVRWPGIRQVVLNADDAEVLKLSDYVEQGVEVVAFSRQGSSAAQVFARDMTYTKHGLSFTLETPTGAGRVENHLVGEFNVLNLLAVASVLYCRGVDGVQIARALSRISRVPGRMQEVSVEGREDELPGVIVDFAHTPDALEKVLTALKPHCQGRLWCVFGCGGERDKGKRPEMGAIAAKYADRVIITADNPRNESLSEIIQEIENGIEIGAAYQVELDRTEAIRSAVMSAESNDLILIAGKGHENYQEINGTKHPFSDQEIVENVLLERRRTKLADGGEERC